MKKLINILVLCILSCVVFAQESTMKTTGMTTMKITMVKTDCVMMRDSMLMITKHGEITMMGNPIHLNNGAVVMLNGIVKMADGTSSLLKEGQFIDMEGNVGMIDEKRGKL